MMVQHVQVQSCVWPWISSVPDVLFRIPLPLQIVRVRSAETSSFCLSPSGDRFWSIPMGTGTCMSSSRRLFNRGESVQCYHVVIMHLRGRLVLPGRITLIVRISNLCPSPLRTFRIRGGYKVGWNRRCVLSIICIAVRTLCSFPRVSAMHLHWSQILLAPSIPPPPLGAVSYYPPQICKNRPSGDTHQTMVSYKPAPTTIGKRLCFHR